MDVMPPEQDLQAAWHPAALVLHRGCQLECGALQPAVVLRAHGQCKHQVSSGARASSGAAAQHAMVGGTVALLWTAACPPATQPPHGE